MTPPTIGRVVYYWPSAAWDKPCAAIIADVFYNGEVNLLVIDRFGGTHGVSRVPFIHDGSRPDGNFAEWMPYQKGQAAKTEALEKQLQEKS